MELGQLLDKGNEMRIRLTNNFHNTETYIFLKPTGEYLVSRRAAKRSANALCGIKGCTCGDTFGARGGHYLEVINETWNQDYIVRAHDLEVQS